MGVDCALVISRETEVSISTNPTLYAVALPQIIKKHRSYFREDKEALAHWSRSALALSLRNARFLDAARWAWEMVRADFSSTNSILRGRLPRIIEHGSISAVPRLRPVSCEGS
ncbi:hypothetical protein GCM10009650_06780 [Nesterenkonia jeotgali]